jgi:hypothetical protein
LPWRHLNRNAVNRHLLVPPQRDQTVATGCLTTVEVTPT